MRIAIDARFVADHFPGIGRYTYNLLAALARLERPQRLLVLHDPAAHNTRFDMAALAALPALELVPLRAGPFAPGAQLAIPRLLRRLRADLYHAPYYVRPLLGLPCPSVTTLYDIIPRRFPAEATLRARLLFDLLTRLAVARSQRLLAISESARRDLIGAYRIAPARISTTPLAADPRYRPLPPEALAALRARYGLPERYLLTLCSNKPHKNLPVLVEAFAALRAPAHLVIAGHWDPRFPQAREAVARLGLAGRVTFLADLAEADLPALYGAAELFVYPSRYEGFGLPPLEALACGLPVVCGDASSLPEVVGQAALLADVERPAALAAALERALADDALRARLRALAPAQAARFSWRRTAELTLDVYRSVLDA